MCYPLPPGLRCLCGRPVSFGVSPPGGPLKGTSFSSCCFQDVLLACDSQRLHCDAGLSRRGPTLTSWGEGSGGPGVLRAQPPFHCRSGGCAGAGAPLPSRTPRGLSPRAQGAPRWWLQPRERSPLLAELGRCGSLGSNTKDSPF